MLSPGETVVVGVSGGADSISLLFLLNELEEYGLKLIVAHLNHGIRIEEGKRDTEFVAEIAQDLGLTFELREVDAPQFKTDSHSSLEDAARILRYRFFREIQSKYQAQKIATAHTLDDQAETVLMRLIRGSGFLGLSGISPVSEGCIIRPLIETSRSDIEDYLRKRGISWVEDSTNKSTHHLRNRIRLKLIPELEKYNPKIKETLSRTANILRLEEGFIEENLEGWLERVFQSIDENEMLGTVSQYRLIPHALRPAFLRMAIKNLKGDLKQITAAHVFSVDEFLLSETPSGEISLPDDIVVAKGYDLFVVTMKYELERGFSYQIASRGKWSFHEFELEAEVVEAESLDVDRYTAFLDLDAADFPIEVNSFVDGMRFVPLGMQSEKKVKRFFIDEKVPRFLRNRIPIFHHKGEIMWIGGMRIDERFKVKGKGEVLRIKLIRPRW